VVSVALVPCGVSGAVQRGQARCFRRWSDDEFARQENLSSKIDIPMSICTQQALDNMAATLQPERLVHRRVAAAGLRPLKATAGPAAAAAPEGPTGARRLWASAADCF
jgi:hypothetical protein